MTGPRLRPSSDISPKTNRHTRTHSHLSKMPTDLHPNQKCILEYNYDIQSEEQQRRVCLEVPCVVRLSHANVITWFERKVQKKVKENNNKKWRYYLDKETRIAYLKRRGAFLYDKYLSATLESLHKYNVRLLRYIVWDKFPRDDLDLPSTQTSLETIFDTESMFSQFSLESSQLTEPSMSEFEYHLDQVITSTQTDN